MKMEPRTLDFVMIRKNVKVELGRDCIYYSMIYTGTPCNHWDHYVHQRQWGCPEFPSKNTTWLAGTTACSNMFDLSQNDDFLRLYSWIDLLVISAFHHLGLSFNRCKKQPELFQKTPGNCRKKKNGTVAKRKRTVAKKTKSLFLSFFHTQCVW